MFHLIRKNIAYRPVRNGALIFCFAIIASSLFAGNYILAGATDSVESGISRLGADIIVVPAEYEGKSEAVLLRGEPSTFFFDHDVVPAIQSVEGANKIAPQLYIATLTAACCYLPVQLIAFDSDRDFTITPWLREHNLEPLKKDEIIVGNLIVPDKGATLKFYGHDFTIAGKLDPTGTGLDTSIFVRYDDAYTMARESKEKAVSELVLPENGSSAVLVQVKDPSKIKQISEQITKTVHGSKALTPELLISTVTGQLNSVTQLLYLTSVIASIVALPLTALISIMVANERIRETGVLRALGADKGTVFKLIFGEAIIISFIGGALGIIISWLLFILFQELIGSLIHIPLTIPHITDLISISLTALILTIVVGGIASLYPAYRSATIEPYTAIRSGEL
jgi:putative ABC transport system permease protein